MRPLTNATASTSPPFRHPTAVRVAQAGVKAHPRLSGKTGPNGSGTAANRSTSKRDRARSSQTHRTAHKTPPPNQPDPRRRRQSTAQTSQTPNRRRQNAAHTHKTAPRIRRPKHPRQKAPKIKWGPDQTRTPLALFRAMPLNCGFYSQPRQCFRGDGLCSTSAFSIDARDRRSTLEAFTRGGKIGFAT